MPYKIVKKSNGKIKCIRDESSEKEIKPEDLNLSDNYNKINVQLLENALDFELYPEKPVKLFDLLNDISFGKQNLIEGNEDAYAEFVINRILSYSQDCIFPVHEMNMRSSLSKKMQYKYLSNSIRKKKRFNKVHKSQKDEDALIISKIYNLSERKARQVLEIIYNEIKELPKVYKEAYEKL